MFSHVWGLVSRGLYVLGVFMSEGGGGMNYIRKLTPSGTNSTHFTECCNAAICDDQPSCPSCGEEVIGYDELTPYDRGRVRWAYATSSWRRREE